MRNKFSVNKSVNRSNTKKSKRNIKKYSKHKTKQKGSGMYNGGLRFNSIHNKPGTPVSVMNKNTFNIESFKRASSKTDNHIKQLLSHAKKSNNKIQQLPNNENVIYSKIKSGNHIKPNSVTETIRLDKELTKLRETMSSERTHKQESNITSILAEKSRHLLTQHKFDEHKESVVNYVSDLIKKQNEDIIKIIDVSVRTYPIKTLIQKYQKIHKQVEMNKKICEALLDPFELSHPEDTVKPNFLGRIKTELEYRYNLTTTFKNTLNNNNHNAMGQILGSFYRR